MTNTYSPRRVALRRRCRKSLLAWERLCREFPAARGLTFLIGESIGFALLCLLFYALTHLVFALQ